MSEYTSELMLLCNILTFVCMLVFMYLALTAWRARDQHYDSWQEAEWNLTKSNAEKDPAKEAEDLKKAIWYLERRIRQVEGEE